MRFFYVRTLLIGGLFSMATLRGVAQTPAAYPASDIYQQLKKLNVLGSVLYMAAHPDDENTRLLAFLAKDRLYRTGYLSLTRGDGGQNLIGDEQGIDLGLIRTQELLAARRIDGAEQFFSRAYDFGFSKSTEEAFRIWDKDKILADAVWVIRQFQPDVIITRFPEDSRAGHGHHSGSAVIAHEAFRAAADSTRFPEQFTLGVRPWKVKRILWNTFNFGGNNTTSNEQLKIEVGGYNAFLGKSYGEIAAESRSQHKSQGFGVPAARGASTEFFSHTEGDPARTDLMDDVNTTWQRVPGGAAIAARVDAILQQFSVASPEKSVPALVSLYKAMEQLPQGYWRNGKMAEVQQLIERCSGLWLEAVAANEFAIQGDSIRININLNNRLGAAITLNRFQVDVFDTVVSRQLEVNRNLNFSHDIYVFTTKPLTQPYWLQRKMSEGSFTVDNQLLIGRPESIPSYLASFQLSIEGQPFTFVKPVQFKFTDPVKGELYRPLVVVPAATVSTGPGLVIFRQQEKQKAEVQVNVTANKSFNGYKAAINRRMKNENITHRDTAFDLARGMNRQYDFTIANTTLKGAEQDHVQAFVDLQNGKEEQPAYLNMTTISYDHIPPIHYFYQDDIKVLNIDLKTTGKRIGYIEGAGDKVPAALEQMGYEVVALKEKDITAASLKGLDAVIAGVRAYNIHDWLQVKYPLLMEYVQNGGNLIVQYNTNNFSSTLKAKMGPYPFQVTRNRVTDETATVNFLLPNHPVLNYPNKITQKDFDNWVQERGIYFADQVDPAFQQPLSMADPNEPAQSGSLIIANYGKGKFVYTGLVFFRELPAAVPGAYRLLANIIALNKKQDSK
ncbi:MAG: PIG-L family deacetylase [Candidatus Pseudobacter hemicellulosilyticus]|uniref:PIG-L family deacetylase n=1 Tax=Candidatus Pseudobacter hemicellulosilyticus TaxID=3121375 RepID=A0AAJ6BFJ8_9BACT|nr:MAG: PIG-L family deacetylase [Pseudobacter sp.]